MLINQQIKAMDTNFNKKFDEMEQHISQVDSSVKMLNHKFSKYEPVFEKAGLTYELSVRRAVSDQRGVPFSRTFRMENLAGLARISAPKDVDNHLQPVPAWNTNAVLQQRIRQLAEEAIHFIPRIRGMAADEVPGIIITKKKKYLISSQLAEFDALASDHARLNFLGEKKLGLMAFSCKAYNDTQSFEDILECDIRGESQIRGGSIDISVGEVKSGKDRGKSIDQLLKRLCIIGHASRVIFGEDNSTGSQLLFLNLQGEIYTPLDWKHVSSDEIIKGLAKLNLFKPAFGAINFRINLLL
jgi:hypothetical protein